MYKVLHRIARATLNVVTVLALLFNDVDTCIYEYRIILVMNFQHSTITVATYNSVLFTHVFTYRVKLLQATRKEYGKSAPLKPKYSLPCLPMEFSQQQHCHSSLQELSIKMSLSQPLSNTLYVKLLGQEQTAIAQNLNNSLTVDQQQRSSSCLVLYPMSTSSLLSIGEKPRAYVREFGTGAVEAVPAVLRQS